MEEGSSRTSNLDNAKLYSGRNLWIPWAKVPAVPSGCGCDAGSSEGQRVVSAVLAKASVSWTDSQST